MKKKLDQKQKELQNNLRLLEKHKNDIQFFKSRCGDLEN